MQLQYRRNSYTWSYCWKKTSQNGARENQGHQRMENTYKNQGCQKFPRVCKFLLKIHSEFQLYDKTIK